MGKYAILLVLAFSLTAGYIGYILNTSKTGLITNVSGFDRYANARNIAHTSVNMLLHQFDMDYPLVDSVNSGKTVNMVVNTMSRGLFVTSETHTSAPAAGHRRYLCERALHGHITNHEPEVMETSGAVSSIQFGCEPAYSQRELSDEREPLHRRKRS